MHYANPAAENLFELSSKTFVGHTITDIYQNDVLDAAMRHALPIIAAIPSMI